MEWLSGKKSSFFSREADAPWVNIELGGQGVALALLVRLVRTDVFSSDNGQKIIMNVYTSTGVSIKILVGR